MTAIHQFADLLLHFQVQTQKATEQEIYSSPPTPNDYQKYWAGRLSAAYGVPVISIDGPLFGRFEMEKPFSSPIPSLENDIVGFLNAREYLCQELKYCWNGPIFVAGISWGSARALFFSASIKKDKYIYSAGGQMDKNHDQRTAFNPDEWKAKNINYKHMILDSEFTSMRIVHGQPNLGEYLWTNNYPKILRELAREDKRVEHQVLPVGHEILYEDLHDFFIRYWAGLNPALWARIKISFKSFLGLGTAKE